MAWWLVAIEGSASSLVTMVELCVWGRGGACPRVGEGPRFVGDQLGPLRGIWYTLCLISHPVYKDNPMKKTFRALGLLNGVGPIPSALAGVAALAAVADGRAWGGAWGGEGAENRSVRASVVAYVEGKEVPVPDIRMGDAGTVSRILDEGVNRNQVMDHLKHLTKSIGPRLTGSSNVLAANNWTKSMYTLWGLDNPHIETWGDIGVGFDRGPSTGKLVLRKERRAGMGLSRRA